MAAQTQAFLATVAIIRVKYSPRLRFQKIPFFGKAMSYQAMIRGMRYRASLWALRICPLIPNMCRRIKVVLLWPNEPVWSSFWGVFMMLRSGYPLTDLLSWVRTWVKKIFDKPVIQTARPLPPSTSCTHPLHQMEGKCINKTKATKGAIC